MALPRAGRPPRHRYFEQLKADLEPRFRYVRSEEFEAMLDGVIAQDELKIKLASTFSQYTDYLTDPDHPQAERPLVMVFGPSGSGKTYAIERLVHGVKFPYTIVSGASISPPAYKGKTMTDVLIQHYEDWHTDYGVIFIDEIDKWCRGAIGADSESVSMGIRTQAELLKYVERDRITFIDDQKDIESLEGVVFETRRIFWILAGAFTGLDKIIRDRLHNPSFPAEKVWSEAVEADFRRYGMIPELADRVETWAWVKPLNVNEIMEILQNQYKPRWIRRFAQMGCKLDLDDGALGRCAQEAVNSKEGARVARALLRRSLDDVYHQASKAHLSEVRVDATTVITGRLEIGAGSPAV